MTTVFITGGHSGIGLECTRRLTERGIDVVLAGRSIETMQAVADELSRSSDVDVTALELDLSSLASVRTAAARYRTLIDDGTVTRPNALICNAGGRFDGDVRYSSEGHELTFATNCLGNFLLLQLTLPLLEPDGRVVFTASGTHDPDTMDGRLVGAAVEPNAVALASIGKGEAKPLSAGKRYSTSKLCTVMYAYELARRLDLGGSSIKSIAYDPGSVPQTGFLRDMPKFVQWLSRSSMMTLLSRRLGVTTSTVNFSGGALADLAVAPQYAMDSGVYYQAKEGVLSKVRSSAVSYDEQQAEKLWNDSATLVGLRPEEEAQLLRCHRE